MPVEFPDHFTVEDCRSNPDKVYLFGDNLLKWGKGGQAVIRDEPNAYGIPTKKKPSMGPDAFFTDEEYLANCAAIDDAFSKFPKDRIIVISKSGLGTGRAKLDVLAPLTFRYLNDRLRELL